jgi:CRISPR/Cas system-associated exonuclease Cas4 (RecB family)
MIDFDQLVDKYFKRELKVKLIGRYYPSEVGQCLRKSYYSFMLPKETDKDLAKIFEAGNILHEFVAKVFASEKNPDVDLVESETPFEIPIDDFIISGRIDNIILLKPEQKRIVVEVKSTKMLSMMEDAQESHKMQLQLYLHAKQIQHGMILYLEKNTLQSKTFYCEYDPEFYRQIIHRFRKLHNHLQTTSLPEPESRMKAEKTWMCRNCEYREECFKDTPKLDLDAFL